MMMIFAEYEDIFVLNFKASKGITRSQGLTLFFFFFGFLVGSIARQSSGYRALYITLAWSWTWVWFGSLLT